MNPGHDRIILETMKFFVVSPNLTVNAAEIERIVNDPGTASTIIFRSGKSVVITDTEARHLIDDLKGL